MLSGNLADELLIEILIRTPAKSLVRFKAVSKSWEHLFTDPYFIFNHRKTRAALTNKNNGWLLACFNNDSADFFNRRHFFLKLNNETTDLVEIEDMYVLQNQSVNIKAAADGIFFVRGRDNYLLWNPSTTESIKVPDFDLYCTVTDIIGLGSTEFYGLGFGSQCDDIKVVFVCMAVVPRVGRIYKAAVWTLNVGSWREIDLVPQFEIKNFMYQKRTQTYVDGKCYWYMRSRDEELKRSILSFDVVEEKFRFIPLPTVDKYCNGYGDMIMKLQGSIGLLKFYPSVTNAFDIWLMSYEVGVDSLSRVSWSKYLKLETPSRVLTSFNPLRIACTHREMVFVDDDGYLSFHNLRTNVTTTSKRKFDWTARFSGEPFFVHEESMVSFKRSIKNS